ncbi:DUF3027 domain-containing protein [Arthrobacter sp. Sr24]
MTEISSTSDEQAPTDPTALPGVPVWRVGKPDAFLAADVDTARAAVASIASDWAIGKHLGARSEGVRCVTHLFESRQPGYSGWVWFASLSRVSRSKESTVNEVGMLPTEDSVLAPAWVPWAERVRPEDQQDDEPAAVETHSEADDAEADAATDDHGDDAGATDSDEGFEADADGADADGEDADDADESHDEAETH